MLFDESALRALVDETVRVAVREELARAPAEMEYLSVSKAAARIDVTPATIREWVSQGRLGRYGAGRVLRIKIVELDEMLASGPTRIGPTREPTPEEAANTFMRKRAIRRVSQRNE